MKDRPGISVRAIYASPVKSLRLNRLDEAMVTKRGIEGDRAFFVIDERGQLVTQRECGELALVEAGYDVAGDYVRLTFPDGTTVAGQAEPAEQYGPKYWGDYEMQGAAVAGPFSEALSAYAGRPLVLAKAPRGAVFDAFAVSILSDESVQRLRREEGFADIDERRFRPTIFVAGVGEAHGEDEWIGREVTIGELTVSVAMRDSRCVMTTHNPDTGQHDLNTLKAIAAYRTDQRKEVNFGVYAKVVQRGRVRVGDDVMVGDPVAPAPSV